MRFTWKKMISATLLSLAAMAASGCEVDVNEGPLEEAAESVEGE